MVFIHTFQKINRCGRPTVKINRQQQRQRRHHHHRRQPVGVSGKGRGIKIGFTRTGDCLRKRNGIHQFSNFRIDPDGRVQSGNFFFTINI